MQLLKPRMSYARIMTIGFITVILLGSLLLMLPVSARDGSYTPFVDAFFTATSATCVTGLIVFDTYTHWSLFGQIVLLLLIQIGGLGFMTLMSMFSVFMKKRISLRERKLLMQSSGSMRLSGVTTLIRRVLLGTFAIEGAGAVLLATRFCGKMGFWQGIYNAVWHSVSAFCNAGFDLMGKYEPFSSFTTFSGDPVVCLTLISLIILGGIGFLVWNDVLDHGWHLKKYELHSKVVLCATAFLVLFGWVVLYFTEGNASLSGLQGSDKVIAALFQSVTTRTAGFNTIDEGQLSAAGTILSVLFMLIGGSPASTAGGIKTTTVAVAFLSAIAAARQNDDIVIFRKRLHHGLIVQASAIITIYSITAMIGTSVICILDKIPLVPAVFEVISAVGTVGLTMGLTPSLSTVSHVILALLMFFGRIGGLSLVLALTEERPKNLLERPADNILIG